MTSKKDPKQSKPDSSSKDLVDLGDDLLEQTASFRESTDSVQTPFSNPSDYRSDKITDLPDVLKSVDILISEGMLDEAKKVLHSALRSAPHHIPAREKLKALHELELKYIFTGQTGVSAPDGRRKPEAPPSRAQVDTILQKLDHDFKLELDPISGLSLFSEEGQIEKYGRDLEKSLGELGARGRMDIGISFLEMGLPSVAARQFKSALRTAETSSEGDLRLGAANLLALALIQSGKPFDAVVCLEPFVSDSEIAPEDRIHFFYLMGIAHEQIGKRDVAQRWFHRASEVDPYYRDVSERLRD